MCGGSNSTQSMTDNNGNLKKQHVDVPDNEQVSSYVAYTSWFSYDALNRLQAVNGERWASGPNVVSDYWRQTNIYDRYGNRRIDPNGTATYGTGINNQDFTVNTANNRLGVPAGQSGVMTYDGAGNLVNDTYTVRAHEIMMRRIASSRRLVELLVPCSITLTIAMANGLGGRLKEWRAGRCTALRESCWLNMRRMAPPPVRNGSMVIVMGSC
jgi:hypothetical protein